MTTACGIFLFFLHKKGKRTGKKQHKTCNGHCTSEYDLHKCNFKNSSAIQIKVFELLFEAKKKKKNCRRTWRQWFGAPATSLQLVSAEDLVASTGWKLLSWFLIR